MLWTYYRAIKQRDGAAIAPATGARPRKKEARQTKKKVA
jgi:hypothetical protein